MNLEPVTKEQSGKLLRLGFDEPCSQYYIQDGSLRNMKWEDGLPVDTQLIIAGTPAPRVTFAITWLRRIKSIAVNCSMTPGGSAKYTVMVFIDGATGWDTFLANYATTYEEAESAGLDWALNYLLEKK